MQTSRGNMNDMNCTSNMKNQRTWFKMFTASCTIFMCILSATLAYPKDYTFTWSANPEPVEGYKLYYKKGGSAAPPYNGTAAGTGPSPIRLGKITRYTITGLDENATYHFTLTAFNGSAESGYAGVITVNPSSQPVPAPIINGIRMVE